MYLGALVCSEKRSDATPSVHRTAVIEIAERTPESRFAAYDEPISVGFAADARAAAEENESRAALGDDMRTVRWTDGDNVALWATNASGGGDIAGEIFRYYTQSAENAARFTGNMKVAADEYECVAVYPVPSRVEGRRVTYTLPAVQDGVYRSELDVMSSDPSSGKLVEVSGGGGVRLTMHHRCHALRIRVPEGKNRWGKPVTRLLVEFPREVAGDMSFVETFGDPKTNQLGTLPNFPSYLDSPATQAGLPGTTCRVGSTHHPSLQSAICLRLSQQSTVPRPPLSGPWLSPSPSSLLPSGSSN